MDAGSLYVTYGQLKRAVDSAAVAAANEFKRNSACDPTDPACLAAILDNMLHSAEEVLKLQNVDINTTDLEVLICDSDGDGLRDAALATTHPVFFNRCPNTPTQQARKLVWIDATQEAPLYFLHLLGFSEIDLTTDAIAEAASVDLVLVFDISESMASDTLAALCQPFWDAGGACPYVDNYDPNNLGSPAGCNTDDSCQPLLQAKDAAKALLDNLYSGYDQVSIVTFDTQAITTFALGQDMDGPGGTTHMQQAVAAIDSLWLHDDAPYARIWSRWKTHSGMFNPVNPEDRDGDGNDNDDDLPTCQEDALHPLCCWLDDDRWDDVFEPGGHNPWGWGGMPCDDDGVLDSYDWNGDGVYTGDDDAGLRAWLQEGFQTPDANGRVSTSPLSTCTGCGIRMASNILRNNGRSGSVWVVVFLSDGMVNLSDTHGGQGASLGDTPFTLGNVDNHYPNGFCTGGMNTGFWNSVCYDFSFNPRYCIDTADSTCPPVTLWDGTAPNLTYSVLDYARDMVDETALTRSLNLLEPGGNEIAIYSIGLGAVGGTGATVTAGENLLRYMAAVGDDGDRETDPCDSVGPRQTCGQYYYAPSGAALAGIFEDIATRIYTRISE